MDDLKPADLEPEVESEWEPDPEDFEDEYAAVVDSTPSAHVASPKVEDAAAHWSKLIEGFETSALDYYAALEAALIRRRIPKIRIGHVNFAEGGLLDARREYLRVQREGLQIDICAAPFGPGFFFSWWLAGRRNLAWLAVPLIGLVGLIGISANGGISAGTRLLASVLLLFALGIGTSLAYRLLKRVTYYTPDTMRMFSSAVHSAVLETIDDLTAAQGLRALSEEERKPIMREFLRS